MDRNSNPHKPARTFIPPPASACGFFNPRAEIPGWAAAAAAEEESRKDAMLGLPEAICALPVRPLTWRHLLWLDIYQSPFLLDCPAETLLGIPDLDLHIARFMWVLAPHWKPYGGLRRKIHFWQYRRRLYRNDTKLAEITRAIHAFMEESLFDLKSNSSRGRRKSYYSPAAGMMHALCSTYGGLSPDPDSGRAAIDLPLKIVGQLLRARIRQEDPKALLDNRTDALERKHLEELNRKIRGN